MVLVAWVWLAAVTFVAGCAWRAWRYVKAPVHLRWDLYPADQHASTRPMSAVGQVTTMLGEVLLLRGVWLHNRRVFWGSLAFHWGLYLLIATTALLALAALAVAAGWTVGLARALAIVGASLLVVGSVRLLVLRSMDAGLKRYSSPLDRLNLAAFAAIGLLSAAVALPADGMRPVAAAIAALARFRPPDVSSLVAGQMALAGLVLLYFPFTRMVHFFAKYFLYHEVLWDDRAVVPGSAMERRLRGALAYGVSWSAGHVGAGRSWRSVAGDGTLAEGERR